MGTLGKITQTWVVAGITQTWVVAGTPNHTSNQQISRSGPGQLEGYWSTVGTW